MKVSRSANLTDYALTVEQMSCSASKLNSPPGSACATEMCHNSLGLCRAPPVLGWFPRGAQMGRLEAI